MIDVTNIDIQVGDFVEVFGMKKSLYEMANKINTITYELLTNMSKNLQEWLIDLQKEPLLFISTWEF